MGVYREEVSPTLVANGSRHRFWTWGATYRMEENYRGPLHESVVKGMSNTNFELGVVSLFSAIWNLPGAVPIFWSWNSIQNLVYFCLGARASFVFPYSWTKTSTLAQYTYFSIHISGTALIGLCRKLLIQTKNQTSSQATLLPFRYSDKRDIRVGLWCNETPPMAAASGPTARP